MADELRTVTSWELRAAGARPSEPRESWVNEFDIPAAGHSFRAEQSVGFVAVEALALPPDYSTIKGFVGEFENIDPMNYVELYTALAGTAFARIYPGERVGPIRLTPTVSGNLSARASTAAVRLRYRLVSEG